MSWAARPFPTARNPVISPRMKTIIAFLLKLLPVLAGRPGSRMASKFRLWIGRFRLEWSGSVRTGD